MTIKLTLALAGVLDGKAIEPWQVNRACEILAGIWSVSAEEADRCLLENLKRLVGAGAL